MFGESEGAGEKFDRIFVLPAEEISKTREDGRVQLDTVVRKSSGKAGDGIGDGRIVPLHEGDEGVLANAEVEAGIGGNLSDPFGIFFLSQNPGRKDGAARGERMPFDLRCDSFGDFVSHD